MLCQQGILIFKCSDWNWLYEHWSVSIRTRLQTFQADHASYNRLPRRIGVVDVSPGSRGGDNCDSRGIEETTNVRKLIPFWAFTITCAFFYLFGFVALHKMKRSVYEEIKQKCIENVPRYEFQCISLQKVGWNIHPVPCPQKAQVDALA